MSKEATARSAMKRRVDKIKSTFWEGYLPEPVKPRGEATLAQQCKWPTCQSEEYQQALAEQIKRELVGEQPAQRSEASTWVGLSDEDLANCSGHEVRWALYWEKLLKERNT